jgi:hypothetical protein
MDLLDIMEVFVKNTDIGMNDTNKITFCGHLSERDAMNGKWKAVREATMWWEDRKQLDADGYWSMVTYFDDGKWRAI